MINIFSNINQFTHQLVAQVLKPGDQAIDGTLGNGHDTIFLLKLLKGTGQVYGFDIQQEAVESTRQLLEANQVTTGYQLIQKGHQFIREMVRGPVRVVMFNLGYLPGGDHSIITLPETTLAAINQSLELLEPGGLITITLYCGHPGGMDEKTAVEELLGSLDKREWDVLKWTFLNRSEKAPYLIVIYRRGGRGHEN